MIPSIVRWSIALGVTRTLEKTGRAITPVTSRLPLGPATAQLLTHTCSPDLSYG